MTFSAYFQQKSAPGKISLRRKQFRMAESNAAMAIWLGKQYLGQKDKSELSLEDETAIKLGYEIIKKEK